MILNLLSQVLSCRSSAASTLRASGSLRRLEARRSSSSACREFSSESVKCLEEFRLVCWAREHQTKSAEIRLSFSVSSYTLLRSF